MKASEFKKFKSYIWNNGVDDCLLCAGYLWFRLTDNQVDETAVLLLLKGYSFNGGYCEFNNGMKIYLPNGEKLEKLKNRIYFQIGRGILNNYA